jgi:hypothetical protein
MANTNVVKMEETKPGYRTSEFWVGIIAVVLINLDVVKLPAKWDGLVMLAALVGYQVSRGIAKNGVEYAEFPVELLEQEPPPLEVKAEVTVEDEKPKPTPRSRKRA